MENRKGSGIFLGVIGVATLVVAIIGATFAYFSATAQSAYNAVTAQSTQLSLGYEDTTGTNLKTALIPAADNIAIFAANRQGAGAASGSLPNANAQCIDDYGNEVCSVYQFTIGNPNKTTAQSITGTMEVAVNTFKNLYYAIYLIDETGSATEVTGATPLKDSQNPQTAPYTIELDDLDQTLAPSNAAADASATLLTTAPSAYTLVTDTNFSPTRYNKRTYRLILWIQEAGADNDANDTSKSFAAQIKFSNGSNGVTGTIAAAN